MATRTIELTGPIMWAHIFEENRDMNGYEGAYREHDGAYTVEIGLDKDQFQALKDIGSAKRAKDIDGKEDRYDPDYKWVKLVRKHKDRFDWASGEPKVVDSTDSPWTFEHEGEVYNGSECTVTVSVYDTSYRNGTRLEKVKVLRAADKPEPKKDSEVPF